MKEFSPKLVIFLLGFSLISQVLAMCPEKCTCDDVNLVVTCIKAGLEVMPNTLNPRLKKIVYKYNNFPTVDVSLRYVHIISYYITILFHSLTGEIQYFSYLNLK